MNGTITPCMGCMERKVGCHSSCEAFREWNEKHQAERQKRSAIKNINREFADYKKDTYDKMTSRGAAHYRQKKEKGIRKDVDTGRMEDN